MIPKAQQVLMLELARTARRRRPPTPPASRQFRNIAPKLRLRLRRFRPGERLGFAVAGLSNRLVREGENAPGCGPRPKIGRCSHPS